MCETSFGNLARRHDQETGEPLVVANVGARAAIAIAGGQLGSVLAWLLGATVVLEEEAEPPWSALVATVALRAEAPARTGRKSRLLSQAALDTLAIIAYEQPVTRADIRTIRSVDCDAVVETLRARGLVAEDPHFGGRGRPGLLITTPAFLQYLGLNSLSSLPPRDASLRG